MHDCMVIATCYGEVVLIFCLLMEVQMFVYVSTAHLYVIHSTLYKDVICVICS